jgi:hypothetical protein
VRWIFACVVLAAGVAHADETRRSPYRLSWAFPDNELSAIEIDRGDLAPSRFATDYELVAYLAALKKDRPAKKRSDSTVPARQLTIEQLDGDGKVRSTQRYVASLPVWRKRLGEEMVERLEDEFDAHLRMIFPHGPHGPVAPLDPNEKPPQ